MESEPSYRLAGERDSGTLLALMRELYREDGYPFDAEGAPQALAALLADPRLGQAWLIEVGGTVAGYIVLTYGYSLELMGRDAFIDELYVTPRARGRGVGTRTLAFAEEACRSAGLRALHLQVLSTNPRAAALYRRAGYDDGGRTMLSKQLA